jgi:hypothetical protein
VEAIGGRGRGAIDDRQEDCQGSEKCVDLHGWWSEDRTEETRRQCRRSERVRRCGFDTDGVLMIEWEHTFILILTPALSLRLASSSSLSYSRQSPRLHRPLPDVSFLIRRRGVHA